jgi:CRP-like cAMP-binding protein
LDLVVKKLSRLAPLDAAAREAIASLPHRLQDVGPRQTLVREGDVPGECCVLLDGHACRFKGTAKGERQIVSFHMQGDILDLQLMQLPRADHSVQTITAGKVAWISRDALHQVRRSSQLINDALWRDALIDASIFREWVLNVGRRDARTRIAHVLCEFATRRQAAGLGSPEHFVLPMTQEDIADATGLTVVHVNRTLQTLGREGVIRRNGREVWIADWEIMREVGDFDAAYLHQAAA